jgi:FkbM family methyltransferase
MINYILKSILNFFDSFNQKIILRKLKSIFINNINNIIDVGSHKGETIKFLIKNFNFKNLYGFEPSKENFDYLRFVVNNLNKNNIYIFNKGIGSTEEKKLLKQVSESSSSTYCDLNYNSNYYKKKKLLFSFFSKKIFKEVNTEIITLKNFLNSHNIESVDYLKTDTEGFELTVLKGLGEYINKVKVVHFEHHYDDMIKKDYHFSEIHNLLTDYNFLRILKIKMCFRKSFEYIYINKNFKS